MSGLSAVRTRRGLLPRSLGRAGSGALVLVPLIILALPYLWILTNAFKRPIDASAIPPRFLTPLTLDEFSLLFETDFTKSIVVSVIVTALATIPSLIVGVPAGFALSKGGFFTRRALGGWLLASRLIPSVVFMIPMYLMFHAIGLVDNYLGLMLAYMVGLLPFVIWLMAGYFADIPQELEDAARVDGCSRAQAFIRVILPLSVPGIAVVGLLSAIGAWNEYFIPLILGGGHTTPAPVFINAFVGPNVVSWGQMAASTLILVVPVFVLTLLAQRGLLRGISAGAIKG